MNHTLLPRAARRPRPHTLERRRPSEGRRSPDARRRPTDAVPVAPAGEDPDPGRPDPTDVALLPLFRTARAIVKSDDLAWDVVQETLIRDHRTHGDDRSPLPALRRLCSLVALEVLRSRRRREAHEHAAAERHACDPAAHSGTVDPVREAERAELRRLLADALARLPQDQRRAFELFEFDGHGYACVAEQLGVPIGTVRSRIARARAALREALERTAVAYTTGLAS